MRLGEWLQESSTRYRERAEKLARLPLSDFQRVAFVLMTPRVPYEMAVKQWRRWRASGRVVGPFAPTRAANIHALGNYDRLFGLGRAPHESGRLWAARLGASVKGLGPVKAAFAVCLMQPWAKDVPVCMDLWMARLFGFPEDANSEWDASRFEGAQRQIRILTGVSGNPPFPTQWAAWDWARSRGADEQPMFVKETDIGEDLSCL